MFKHLAHALLIALAAAMLTGCETAKHMSDNKTKLELAKLQPDPAQTVAEKIGQSGVKETSTSDGSVTDNATVQQQYGGATTRTTAIVNAVVPTGEGFRTAEVLRINRTSAQTGTELNFTYEDGNGKRVVFGKGTITADGATAQALSSDTKDQQLDTQTTTREGFNTGADLQRSVDEPGNLKTQADLEKAKAEADAAVKKTEARAEAAAKVVPGVVEGVVNAVNPLP